MVEDMVGLGSIDIVEVVEQGCGVVVGSELVVAFDTVDLALLEFG